MTFTFKPKKLLRVLFLIPMLLIQSCNIEPLPEVSQEQNQENKLENPLRALQVDEFRFFNEILKTPEGLFRWEAQLNKLIENNSFYIGNDLKLLEYKFANNVASKNDLEIIKSELANNFNLIPVAKKNNSREYELSNNVFSTEEFEQALNILFPTSEAMLRLATGEKHDSSNLFDFYKFKRGDLSTVELKWEYNGKMTKTLCLVSLEKGCIYDPFLSFIDYSPKENTSKYAKISSPVSRLQSSSFGGETGVIIFPLVYEEELYDNSYDFNGNLNWWYRINWKMTGESVGGKNIVNDKSLTASHWASIFYSCDAKIQSKSFVTGEDGHLDLAYGYAYKSGVGVSLSWNGFGFTIDGGGSGLTGEDYISANEMYAGY